VSLSHIATRERASWFLRQNVASRAKKAYLTVGRSGRQ
jgi:hypothetical protein